MPRFFDQADDAYLKRTMIPRAPACFFTPEDVEQCIKETGKDKKSIQNWACRLRWRMSINGFPGSMNVEEFLQASDELLSEKVKWNIFRKFGVTWLTSMNIL